MRLFRCVSDEIKETTINQIIEYIETEAEALRFMGLEQSAKDLARLYRIKKNGIEHFRTGMSAASVAKIARFMAEDD